jgi:hypothetical protein
LPRSYGREHSGRGTTRRSWVVTRAEAPVVALAVIVQMTDVCPASPPGHVKGRSAPAGAPATAGQKPVGWRENQHLRAAIPIRCSLAAYRATVGGVLLPLRHCPGRPEPVKSAFGVGSADLRLLTEPARKSRRSQLSGARGVLTQARGRLTTKSPPRRRTSPENQEPQKTVLTLKRQDRTCSPLSCRPPSKRWFILFRIQPWISCAGSWLWSWRRGAFFDIFKHGALFKSL